jgi:pyruvate dehydrogenase E2 component (dihydrolipoamide acetyltransferase)
MPSDMKLPELGENIEGGDVLRVMVKPGDAIKKDQPVLELETDKATIEVPSSADGVIKEIKVEPGQKVKVGQTIFVVDGSSGLSRGSDAAQAVAPESAAPVQSAQVADSLSQPEPEAPRSEKRRGEVVEMKPGKAQQPQQAVAQPAAVDSASIPAAPSARRLARELGVTLQDVQGSGPGGRISIDDVAAFARRLLSGAAGVRGGVQAAPLPDFTHWGSIDRKPMSGVRRTTAHRLTQAWNAVPHVFQHDRADIGAIETLRKRLSKKADAEGKPPITITAFLIRILAAALRKFPQMNASVDLPAEEIVFKSYVHIGVAVDTDRGLLVPVIRDVDQKGIAQIAGEVALAAEKARNRKLSLDDMQGASMTISNLGGIGAGTFDPIVNWPEVAILGVARARVEPFYVDGQFVPRMMMPLTLSYDHRVIDGADGARILRWMVEAIEQPALIWLES